MQFSSRFPIAVHVLLALALFQDQVKATSAFLAGSVNVNPVVIRNVLGQLKAAGLVSVKAGEGGASLAKAPRAISLKEVFQAVEKREPLFHCHDNPNPNCPVGRHVRALLEGQIEAIQGAMAEKMASQTLQDLMVRLEERIESER